MTINSSTTAAGQSTAHRPRRRIDIRRLLEAYALVILVLVLVLFFSVWSKTSDTFPTLANFQILLGNQAVIGIVAIGALIPLVANEWDLSVGAVAGLSAIVTATAMSNGHGVVFSAVCGILIGLAAGAVNAVIVTVFKVNGVITTLGTSTILAGVTSQITNGQSISANIPSSFVNFGLGTFLGIPKLALALAVVVAVAWYVLELTPFGRYLYAIGSNLNAARLVGIRMSRVVVASFLAAAVLSAIGGVLQVARQAGADPRVGPGFTLPALAAAFLSAAAIKPGRYNVLGTIVAILFLAVLNNGLSLAGEPDYVSSYVNGAALIVGVALAAYLGRLRLTSKKSHTS
jgi:ribose transport system permease protein